MGLSRLFMISDCLFKLMIIITFAWLFRPFGNTTWQGIPLWDEFIKVVHAYPIPFMKPLTLLSGTLWQLTVPLMIFFALLLWKRYLYSGLALFLSSSSFIGLAHSVREVSVQTLPLLSSNLIGHDWWHLHNTMKLLPYSGLNANLYLAEGLALYSAALLLCWQSLRR